MIPHASYSPEYTTVISIAIMMIALTGYGIYKGFFANDNLTDPWDDHDDYAD